MEIPESLQRAPQRRKVYEFIKAELEAGRAFPDHESIRVFMNWTGRSAVTDCLGTLAGLDRVLKESPAGGTWRRPRYTYTLKD